MVPDGPVVIFAGDRILNRASLRMALDAGVVRMDVIHPRGVQNVGSRRMRDVLAPRPVAPLAAYIPLGHRLILDVVIHRMAPIASRPGRPFQVVGRIEGRPPIGSIGHEIGAPYMIGNVPLRRLRKVIVSHSS